MIDLILIALFQAAAGDPAPAPVAEPAPAQTETTTTAPAQATESAERPQHRRRCRAQRVTGTRIAGRVCLSDYEQEMLEQEGRDTVNRLQRPPPPPAG